MALNVQGSDSLFFKTGLDTTGLALGSTKTKGILAGLTSNISKMDVFAGLSISAAMAFAAISNKAYKFAKDFETAMKEVETISDAVKANFAGISQEIINMSKEVPGSADQLAKAYYQIVSAGYDGAEAMKVLWTSAKLGVAGVTDTFVAADAITSIMNAYGEAAGNAANIADKLFQTVKLGKTKMEELGPSITTVTGLAAQAGLAFDDLMAIIAKGVKTLGTNEMMTGIRGMLIALTKQQDDTVKKAKELGIEFDITALSTKGFSAFLKDLMDSTGGNIKLLSELFPRVQGLSGVLAVATDAGGDFDSILKQIINSAGSMDEAFRIMIDSTDNQLGLLKNIINAKLKPLGDDILSNVNKIAKSINIALTSSLASVTKASKEERHEFEQNVAILDDLWRKTEKTTTEKELLNKAISILQARYPGYLKNIDLEKTSYEDLTIAVENTRNALIEKFRLNLLIHRQEKEMKEIARLQDLATQKYIERMGYEADLVILREAQNKGLKISNKYLHSMETTEEAIKLLEGWLLRTKIDQNSLLDDSTEKQNKLNEETKDYKAAWTDIENELKGSNTELTKTEKKISDLVESFSKVVKFKFDIEMPEEFKAPDFQAETKSLRELMTIFAEHTEQLENLRQAGVDTTELLSEQWQIFADNVKESYKDEPEVYQAVLNMKKDADTEYLEWKKQKWMEENELAVSGFNAMGDAYLSMLDDMLAGENMQKMKLSKYWKQMANSFILEVNRMMLKWLAFQALKLIIPGGGALAGILKTNKGGEVPGANLGGQIIDYNKIVQMSGGGEMQHGSDLNKDSILTYLTKNEIVVNRESSQYKDNRDHLLNINRDKEYIYKNFIPKDILALSTGGIADIKNNINIPDFNIPDIGNISFPTDFSSSQLSNKLDVLIKSIYALNMNQQSRSGQTNINIESQLDMESFIINFDKTRSDMVDRGYQ